MSVGARLHR